MARVRAHCVALQYVCTATEPTCTLSQNDLLWCRVVSRRRPARPCSAGTSLPRMMSRPVPIVSTVDYHQALHSARARDNTVQQGQRRCSCVHAAIPKLLAEHRAVSHTTTCQLSAAQAWSYLISWLKDVGFVEAVVRKIVILPMSSDSHVLVRKVITKQSGVL
jgi:hypothetical protein